MKKLILLSIILNVGCDLFDSGDEVNQWTCKLKTDWDGPLIPDYFAPDTTTIYSSFEGCDSVCVKHGAINGEEIENLSPYYCKETN